MPLTLTASRPSTGTVTPMSTATLELDTPAAAAAAPGTLLLRGVVGSTAYGLAHAGSDQDRLGVFAADIADVLGLDGSAHTGLSQVTKDPDQTLHEVAKFASLATKVNPTVTELLWLEEYEVVTDAGAALVALRSKVLSTQCVVNSYGGYATAQAKKLLARSARGEAGFSAGGAGRTAKHGRHCLRLLRQGRHLLATGELMVNVAHLREELFAAGELAADDPGAFHDLFRAEMATFDTTSSVLPDAPDREAVNRYLVEVRTSSLR